MIYMKVYSHRGESTYACENTMSAFYLAEFVKSDGIECDIRKTRDDILVIIHDKSIDRTSSKSGNVSDYTYEELLEFDFGNSKFHGEKIVRLDEFLKYFSQKKMHIFLEIKEEGYESKIVNIVKKYNNEYITLISFKYEILEKIRAISNALNLGWLTYDFSQRVLQKCKNIKLNQVLVMSISLQKSEVKILHDEGFIVTAWGVINKADISRLYKIGVDRIIYDSGYDAKKVIKELESE